MSVKNSVYFHLDVIDLKKSRDFYVDGIQLFLEYHDYGMDTILLKSKQIENFGIIIQEKKITKIPKIPLFTLNVNNVYNEYEKIKNIDSLFDGGLCQESKNGLFEYPLESSFLVCDPSGNKFLISSGIKLWKH